MKVREVMMGTPYSCTPDMNLGQATEQMWKANCGFLPVVGADAKVCGVLTDRDICIALGTRCATAGEVRVAEVCQSKVYACNAEDEIHVALQTMREGHVRRLPVVDHEGRLAGVISMDDIMLRAEPTSYGQHPELSSDEVVRAFRVIARKDLPVRTKKAAA